MAMHHDIQSTIGKWQVGWSYVTNPEYIQQNSYDFQAFPSAHSATAFGFALGLSWLFPKGRWYFFALAILAASQRVLSLAHWTSDVFFGAAVGLLVSGIITSTRFSNYCWNILENSGARESTAPAKESTCDPTDRANKENLTTSDSESDKLVA